MNATHHPTLAIATPATPPAGGHAAAHTEQMTGARMVVRALLDQGVEVVFGYPGGAVLPI